MTYTEDRRSTDQYLDMLAALTRSVDALRQEVMELRDDVTEVRKVESAVNGLTLQLTSAFPVGDYDGHRRAHEAMIAQAEERAELFKRLRIKAGEMTVWAFFGVIGTLLIYYWNGHMPTSAHITVSK